MKILLAVMLCAVMHVCEPVRVTLKDSRTGVVPIDVNQGENAMLSCYASFSSSDTGAELEWSYGTSEESLNQLVYEGGDIHPSFQGKATWQPKYSIQLVETIASDSGFYKCRVKQSSDDPPVDYATYELTVKVPPYEKISCGFPADLQITLGQQVEFRCREEVPTAQPDPTYTWYKNGIILPETTNGNGNFANSSFSYSRSDGVLKFSSVTKGDTGTYFCRVENIAGFSDCDAKRITTKEVNVGAIVGIVFGVIFGLLLIGVLVWWTWSRGYCDGLFGSKDVDDDDARDDGANDIMLDGAGPLVTKEPSEWSNGTSNKNSIRSTDRRMPEGAVRVMP